jgi:hypothetical protein
MLSAVEVLMYEVEHHLLIVGNIAAQGSIVVALQTLDNSVNHCRAEDIVLLEYCALALKTLGRGCTAIWQTLKAIQTVGILLLVDVYVDVALLGNRKGVIHLKTVSASHSKTRDELIDICTAIW